jgi:hypothetical protein
VHVTLFKKNSCVLHYNNAQVRDEIHYYIEIGVITATLRANMLYKFTYIHTYHSRFIPGGVAEVSQIFLRDTHVLPKLVSYEQHCRRDWW